MSVFVEVCPTLVLTNKLFCSSYKSSWLMYLCLGESCTCRSRGLNSFGLCAVSNTTQCKFALCSRVFPCVYCFPVCSPVFSCNHLCSRAFLCVHLCSRVFSCTCVHLCSRVFACIHLCYSVFPCVHLCTRVFPYVLTCVPVCVHVCSPVFKCVHMCCGVFPNVHLCSCVLLITLCSHVFLSLPVC